MYLLAEDPVASLESLPFYSLAMCCDPDLAKANSQSQLGSRQRNQEAAEEVAKPIPHRYPLDSTDTPGVPRGRFWLYRCLTQGPTDLQNIAHQ